MRRRQVKVLKFTAMRIMNCSSSMGLWVPNLRVNLRFVLMEVFVTFSLFPDRLVPDHAVAVSPKSATLRMIALELLGLGADRRTALTWPGSQILDGT
jgi:hypothetical protein